MRTSAFTCATASSLPACRWPGATERETTYTKVEPAKVEHKAGSEISKLTLTEKAMERLGVKTTPIVEGKIEGAANDAPRQSVPYSAVMYVPNGDTFVYTSPSPRTFVRDRYNIDYIEREVAVLKDGPPAGTQVVTVGAAELFGTEFGVGH